ncbi:interferon lambda-4-like [Pteronotus mesoamericanus]|uniref:interferon lambda-4-like n=1 Tax=Pteronotus mesoamericanus TaxID=1884717 RepID=UPI0023EBDAED|nr:interferon lambda-4-like [Pteronotus parnellii mesoamericanus]XP_054436793.1 interferon lambda-4-like [Pteronotus parnellii mesoamericanus]XP_054436796.1 interferon lambda-4-like [Pteronotus parnellii mesoamericanus]XP_054436797.1 interferon lambda-4-like [Pteronotus parnellii mesoamericanus]
MEGAGTAGEGAEMRPSGAAAASLGLWVLVTASVAADPGAAEPRRCHLSHYRWLEPRALAAVKALRDHYEEETLSWRPRNCPFRPRRDPARPLSCARLRRVARDLSDAQAVLSSLPSPELFPGVARTLDLLAAARRDVVACLELVRPSSSRKSLRPPRRRPKARRADSPRCHEASVIFNLLRLLTWDLRLVAHSGPCL